MNPERIFLSEFGDSRIAQTFTRSRVLFFVYLALGIILTIFVHGAGIAVIKLIDISNGKSISDFGYFAELNHGISFLVLIPMFALLALQAVRAIGYALNNLALMGRILSRGNLTHDETMRFIAEKNRKWFKWIFLLPILLFVFHLGCELPTRNINNLGYVQAYSLFGEFGERRLPQNFVSKLAKEIPKISEVLHNKPDTEFKLLFNRQPSGKNLNLFTLCLVFAIESLGISLMIWLGLKICFVVFMINKMIHKEDLSESTDKPSLNAYPIGLKLDLEDENRRYGMIAFDDIYNKFLVLAGIAVLIMVFGVVSNLNKGTLILVGYYVGQMLVPISVLTVYIVLLGLLTHDIWGTAHRKKVQQMNSIAIEIAGNQSAKEDAGKNQIGNDITRIDQISSQIEKLNKKLSLVQSQSHWPEGNKLAICLIFAMLPSIIYAVLVLLVVFGLSKEFLEKFIPKWPL